MKYIPYIILILLVGCSEREVMEGDGFENPCTSKISITDVSTDFAAEIDGKIWVPGNGSFSSFYDRKLKINAGDLLVQVGAWNIINIQIENPVVGYNDVSFSENNYMLLHHTEDGLGYRTYVDCGFVKLDKLDTVSGSISGYFHGTINQPAEDLEVDISNGVFNDLEITPLFCETSFDLKPVFVDIFQNWKLIGVFNGQGETISHPPCNSSTSLEVTAEENGDLTEYKITGSGVINNYWTDFEIIDSSTITVSSITSTRVGGEEYQLDFERLYFDFLGSSTLTYSIQDNVLSLGNAGADRVLKFVLVD